MARKMGEWEKEVRKVLIDREMSVPDFAKELGISHAYLYDILSGARRADKLRVKINKVLGLE